MSHCMNPATGCEVAPYGGVKACACACSTCVPRRQLLVTASQIEDGYRTRANGYEMAHKYEVIAKLGEDRFLVWEPTARRMR